MSGVSPCSTVTKIVQMAVAKTCGESGVSRMRQPAIDLGTFAQKGHDFVALAICYGGEEFRRESALAVPVHRLRQRARKLQGLLDEENLLAGRRQGLAPEFFRQGKLRRGRGCEDERCGSEGRRSWCGQRAGKIREERTKSISR